MWRFTVYHQCGVPQRIINVAFFNASLMWRFTTHHQCGVSQRIINVAFHNVHHQCCVSPLSSNRRITPIIRLAYHNQNIKMLNFSVL